MNVRNGRALKTGEVAERAGVNIQTVRFYERRGLLPEPPRLRSGYRQYDAEAVSRLRFIRRAQELGFTLDEIADLLSLHSRPDESAAEVKRRASGKIEEIAARIRDLERMKARLEAISAACDGHGSIHDCPILHALAGEEETA